MAHGYNGNAITVGSRIELCPGLDLWMRGARFGKVVEVIETGTIRVKMDHPEVRGVIRVPEDRLRVVR